MGAQLSKSNHILLRLRELIAQLPPKTRLPSEEILASDYKVSRTTVRNALEKLWLEDRIIRRWGEGTFTQSKTARERSPAAIYVDIDEIGLLSSRLQVRGIVLDRMYFELSKTNDHWILKRAFEIEGAPALYLVDILPLQLNGADIEWSRMDDPKVSVTAVLAAHGCRVVKEESDLSIVELPDVARTLWDIDEKVSVLKLDQRAVSETSDIVVNTEAFILLDNFPHRFVRIMAKSKRSRQ